MLMNRIPRISSTASEDGSYRAEFILGSGYVVHFIECCAPLFNARQADLIYQNFQVRNQNFVQHFGELTNFSSLPRFLMEDQKDEVWVEFSCAS